MSDIFDGLGEQARAMLHERAQPAWTAPMLATLTDSAFSDPGWIYERKLDGVRCLVFRHGDSVRIVSRNRKCMNATWPELVEDLEKDPCEDFVADGEIVTLDGARTSFSRLQNRIGIRKAEDARKKGIRVYLYLFDILHVNGHDVTELPLRRRKALLKRALVFHDRIRYTPHRNENGESYLEEACTKGWEGLIAKDAEAPYVHGRSRKWLKFKCVNRQELVIGGFTEPRGSRKGFGALLVGYYENGELHYAGKVGTGYDDRTLQKLAKRLARIERDRSPFTGSVKEKASHFVRPELVGEFGFTEWTDDGKLRHPRFLGLRTDKDPEDVHRERAAT
jgi:bifunctional non-homologous end joining protein LigD